MSQNIDSIIRRHSSRRQQILPSYKGNRVSSVGETRLVWVGGDYGPTSHVQFEDNKIITSKYTIWSFLPKNLFEQFRRIANFYFLCMTIIAISIDSPVEPITSVLPLAFVITVTALKQGYEDWLRHRSDNEVNGALVTVIRKGIVQDIKAKDVHVGDLVRVVSDDDIPCDLVLLASSDTEGRCYITTANLDGETNLKTLTCPRLLRNLSKTEQLARLKAQIECEQPTPDLYKFYGRIEIFPDETDGENVYTLLQSPSNKNTRKESIFNIKNLNGIDHKLFPSTCVDRSISHLPKHKRNFSTGIDNALYNRTHEAMGLGERRATLAEIPVETDIVATIKEAVGNDLLIRGKSYSPDLLKVIPAINNDVHLQMTAFDDDVANGSAWKRTTIGPTIPYGQGSASLKPTSVNGGTEYSSVVETQISTDHRDTIFQSSLASPLGTENLLLRGARLKNTDYVIGCAVYTGQETKLALNSKLTSNKFSTVEKSINRFLLFFLGLLFIEVAVSLALKYAIETDDIYKTTVYVGAPPEDTATQVIKDLLSFVLLYNYIIPISLYVTIETQKFVGSLFFSWDSELYCGKTDQPAICNTSDLNEELGQVEYLFTDKTGTLTENNMQFRRCSINGTAYIEQNGKLMKLQADGDVRHSISVDLFSPELEQFLLCLALCHSVQLSTNSNSNGEGRLDYQASSPDEKALVEASARCGVVFLGEDGESVSVNVRGVVRHYRKLNSLEFTSDRKRMSVIVQDESGNIWLYCKGAESSVIPLAESGPTTVTLQHVADFAMRGLRTLVVCYKKMSAAEYQMLAAQVELSRQTLSSRRISMIAASYDKMENHLTLLGATGVEDQLQDGVQETLESLRAAGIKVWILTGDKVETAVNISFSCGHLKPGTHQMYLTGQNSAQSCLQTLKIHRNQVQREKLQHFGLVVDGQSLGYALLTSDEHKEIFMDICRACTAVICCRMSPLQKCQVVQLVKGFKEKPVTAAIGDGANDVSMIQEAHVGLGIMGKEGRQAVRCSDFAFARFKFVRRILLVHGHWYYLRISTLVQYFFYKNILFIIPQLYYAFNNAFSTQAIYDSMFLTFYNVLFTSLPILIYGLFEQNYSAKALLDYPQLYTNNRRNVLMTWPYFFQWIAIGIWHSVVLFFPTWYTTKTHPALLLDNTTIDLIGFGTFIFHCVVCVANLKLLLHSRYWTWMFVGSILLSIFGFMLVTLIYSTFICTDNMVYVYVELLKSPTIWLLSVLLIVTCLVPDFTLNVLMLHIAPVLSKIWKHWRRKMQHSRSSKHYSFRRSESDRSSDAYIPTRRISGGC